MGRITIELREDESIALLNLAEFKRRDPRKQAAHLVREQLKQLGYILETAAGNAAQPAHSGNGTAHSPNTEE